VALRQLPGRWADGDGMTNWARPSRWRANLRSKPFVDLGPVSWPNDAHECAPLREAVVVATTSLVVSIVAAVAAVVATAIALASARYTRQQANAAERANAIETKRLHTELTPELAIKVILAKSEMIGAASLNIRLTGPAGLDRLDAVTLRIREDRLQYWPRRTPEKIYGPFTFLSESRSGEPAREFGPFTLAKNEPYGTVLKVSAPPSTKIIDGRSEWHDKPVRVEVTCQRDGYEPWIILAEVMAIRANDL
jgi:hypothetical protein